MDIYQFIAAALYISRFPLAAVAIALCIHLFRRTRNTGWLFLGVPFVEPFYYLAIRFARGRPLLQYQTMGPVRGGVAQLTVRYDIPTLYVCAVVGLLLLARRAARESRAQTVSGANGQPAV
jgi:hypothetical protein